MYLNEDMISKWALSQNGLLITRSIMNLNNFNFNEVKPVTICVITGYQNIVTTFFEEILGRLNKALLIIIESDVIHLQKQWLDNKDLIHCFTWNKPFEHKKLSGIPIGLNFKRHYKSIITWINKNQINENSVIEREKLLCFNCSLNTSPERQILKNTIDNRMKEYCDKLDYIAPIETKMMPSYIEGRIRVDVTNPDCYNDWLKYKFILSPEGAGFDCHRTWEAIMVGSIPIVKSSTLNELYTDLPIVTVDKWEDLNVEFLNSKYIEITNNKKQGKYNYNKLYLKYWINVFETTISNAISNIEKPVLLKKHDIHCITYGDNKYKNARIRLVNQAKKFGIFKTIRGFDRSDLTLEFQEKFQDILNMPRGGGYWIWKLDILKQLVDKVPENDFILYLDAGCHLNINGMPRFYEYINMFNDNDYGILGFQMANQPEKYWTTTQILNYFDINENDKDMIESGQLIGGILILRNNAHLKLYLQEFEKCIKHDKYLITDNYNKINQNNYFKDNRHDQSISSIIRKKIGSIVVPKDESWCPPFGKGESLKYPFWAARSKM